MFAVFILRMHCFVEHVLLYILAFYESILHKFVANLGQLVSAEIPFRHLLVGFTAVSVLGVSLIP